MAKRPVPPPRGLRVGLRAAAAAALLFSTQFVMTSPPPAQAAGTTSTVTLHVESARTEPRALGGAGVTKGDAVTAYHFIINEDNTGTTAQRSPSDGCSPAGAGYPDSCKWASVAGLASSAPIVTQGDESDLSGTTGLNLPDGRYLISVQADGFKLDGIHFTVPLASPGLLTVPLQPTPLPTSTIKAQIFADTASTNGQYDPGEDGLAGFQGKLTDYLGEVSTDVFGNPLCTEYETDSAGNVILNAPDYTPTPIPGTGGKCLSGADGVLTIPNMGPNRYALSVVAPAGSSWVQTTTLEGNHDWDAWVMEGSTGLDTEFAVAGEPFPAIIFGFVPGPGNPYWNTHGMGAGGGSIKGVVDAVDNYVPAKGGITLPGTIWGGMQGAKVDHAIDKPWLALSDLNAGDALVWAGRGNSDGTFTIPNVPDGNYTLTWWDEPQDYILDLVNVTVSGGEVVDMKILPLAGWWTPMSGYVFNDTNRNGKMDPGEKGVPNYTLTVRKRENSLMDRGTTTATTDQSGHYVFEGVYPLTQWLVLEAYNDRFYTTGVTYQADNQSEPTTVLGAGVDVSILPIIGLSGRIDWGVHAYDATGTNGVDPQNGGIVGTVSYDTTRNELDPRYAAVEDWQPGVSGLTVDLFAPVPCGTNAGTPCDARGDYELASDGSYAKGKLLNKYVTETWERPTDCTARDVNGDPLAYPADQQVLPAGSGKGCLEGPLMGVQFQNGFSTVDGNYGFGAGCFGPGGATAADTCADGTDPTPLSADDYLVSVEMPNDSFGKPLYKFTREEDINIGNGDSWVPQILPPACAGPLHTVDVAGVGTDNYPAATLADGTHAPASTPVENATFADMGGSPYEGQQRPYCDTKLVNLQNGKSIVPTFNVFTDVPLPGRFFGYLVDDLNYSTDPKSLLFGEKAGLPFAPVGIYDYANRLVDTVETDYNGVYDVLLPSTDRINCPTPSGVCANVYRFVGNDPGIPGRLNLNYNPQFRTIAAEFEALPGLIVPADNAPTQVGVTIQLPGSQQNQAVACTLNDPTAAPTTPELFTVSAPYADVTAGDRSFTITGQGFGATKGSGSVTLDGSTVLPTTAWSDRQIAVTVPASTAAGPHQLAIKAGNGKSTVNGLTFHVVKKAALPAFPSAGVLDNFNRANGSLGANWAGAGTLSQNLFRVNSNAAQVRGLGGFVYWNQGAALGANQEAYFTFGGPLSTTATRQDLLLKMTSPSVLAAGTSYLDVRYNVTNHTVSVETVRNLLTRVTKATWTGVTFAAGDRFGARALADGTVVAYKNGTAIGSTNVTTGANAWPLSLAQAGGRIGVSYAFSNPLSASNNALFDNFGGGNVAIAATYNPDIYEVGATKTYHTIQSALDAAASHLNGQSLVVVYPGQPDLVNPRANPRGAYYENLIVYSPVKLQGVGPGGIYPDGTPVTGSIVDGSAFGGDTPLADAWRAKIASLTWDGNQQVYEGPTISVFARNGQFGSTYKASIDGFDIRGGDQSNFPNNINQTGGGPTGLPANVITQGGGIFVNAYARYLGITNNIVQNNSGSYAGGIRVGTPDLAAPNTSNHNENLRIANNRVIANGGTNLAGGIGIFAGTDGYEVANNDICANFSAEYGGGLSVYGLSPSGKIHDNRIYFNRSYDEGGGIMMAGQLPVDPTILSPGTGAADIYGNLIQANLANDDGGGIRFLMSGNFPFNVYNNIIANNVSTHEGGGIAIDDAPNVRIFNDTIAKNMTTATAVTSNGQPAPAGVSTTSNSDLLQATLPAGSPLFSRPVLFNDVLWDNRAGTRAGSTVTGLGVAGDASPVVHWDLGVADGTGQLAPTNSVLQDTTGTVASATNKVGVNPAFVSEFDTSVAFAPWRNNPNFIDAILVAVDVPPALMGNYHVAATSPAVDAGAASKTVGTVTVAAPSTDIDGDLRPARAGYDAGADEVPLVAAAFPATALVDTFNRANGALGTGWAGSTAQTSFRVASNQTQVVSAGAVWRTATYGPSQEASLKLTKPGPLATEQGLLLKARGESLTENASWISVTYDATHGSVSVKTRAPGQGTVTRATFGASFAAGDTLGAQVLWDGTVTAFRNGARIGSTNVRSGAKPWPDALVSGGGRIGAVFAAPSLAAPNDARFDDFGGGTLR